MSRALIITGLAIAARPAVALDHAAWARPASRRHFQSAEGFTFTAPITTGILASLVLSLILWRCPR
jgi:hypothetical protein